MNWSIEYYSPKLEKEILKLPDGLLARYFHLTDLMLEFGSNLGLPHIDLEAMIQTSKPISLA